MANTLTNVMPKLLAQGLLALRQMAIMPRYVNRAYENLAGEKGSTIDVPIPSAIVAQDVTPANTPPVTSPIAPTKVAIAMSKWKEAAFFMTDKDMQEAMSGTIPMQASEAVKAIANQIDSDILALYTQVYGVAGTAGTTPFSTDLSEFLTADQVLNDQLAPVDPRALVLNARATAQAKGLRAIQDASWRNDPEAMRRSEIGFVLGYSWAMDQNIPTHTTGNATSTFQVNQSTTPTGYAIGDSTIAVDTGTGDFVVGDLITFSGHSQTYAIQSVTGAAPTTSFTIFPALVAAVADNEVITKYASHTVNLAFHRDAFALAMRPFADASAGLGTFVSAVDPVSGLALRLEVSREHKQTRFSYDALYGVQCVRPALAVRLLG